MKRLPTFCKRALVVLTALVVALGCVVPAFADTSYISSWKEYTQEKQPAYKDGTWTFHDIKDAIYDVLDAGQEAIEAGDYDTAKQAGSDGYYGFYDLAFENATNMYISGSRVSEMELLFSDLRTIGNTQGSAEEYENTVNTLKANLEEDANKLDGADLDNGSSSSSSSTSTASDATSTSGSATALVFLGVFSIILREGFEAIIVVGAIIAYLQVRVKNGTADKKKTLYPVYIGSILGIVLSFVMAYILDVLLLANSANQEIIEGFTALFAVCVLFYVCNWMLSKSETEAWTSYIQSKTESGAANGSIFALAFTAFLSVFREGAEVVLFLQPYVADASTRGAVWAGLAVGAAALVVVWLLIHLASVKLPMRLFFNATSILMAFMCVCFLGSGIKELIEGGLLGSYHAPWVDWIPTNDVLDVLGIYPLVNTIVPQIILAVVLIVMFHIGFKKNRAIRAEADARKAEEQAKKDAEEAARKEAEFRTKVEGIVLDVLKTQGLVEESDGKNISPQG